MKYRVEISETPDERGLFGWRVMTADGAVVVTGGGPDLERERAKAERDRDFYERQVQ